VDLNDFDLLFVGTGIYWGNPNADMERYLEKINLKTPKTFALFITWGGAGKTDQASLTKLTRFLENKGHHVLKNQFTCFGGRRFALLKSGHPNAQDISAAKQWARSIIDASQK
jgi:hypothetical protein